MKIAIVTGASSGLGSQYIRQISRTGRFDGIWAVARRRERLEALQKETGTKLRIFPLDLTEKQSFQELSAVLAAEKPEVSLLINAAGFGKIGSYADISLSDCDGMIDLNCRAAVDMTQIVLPYMTRGGRIMQICSTAAFQPFQYLSVYAASKSFLYRYSRALRVELFGRGVKVTAVCPYWIRDTEFIATAKKTGNSSYIRDFPLASREKLVASVSLRDSSLGFAVSTPGVICTLHRIVAKVIPGELMMGLWALIRRI